MDRLAKKIVLRSLRKARKGSLSMTCPDQTSIVFGKPDDHLPVSLEVLDERFFTELVGKGGIGLGEAYQKGYWKSNDLPGALRWLLVNSQHIAPDVSPHLARLARFANALFNGFLHFRNRNSIEGSQQNIHVHYDLGNEFYQKFLDPSLTYSSAYFQNEDTSLEEAQFEKYDRLCRKLRIEPGMKLLEIGCGWGGFALHAASRYGCRVVGTTISKEQYDKAIQRVADAGLEDRIEITMTDYRKLTGKFDRIASIEMLEAVGQEYLGSYFKQVEYLLAPDGLAGIQVITTPNPLYEGYRRRVDWIQKHIFPGSHLPSTRALLENAETLGSLDLYHMESFGLHYARTLREWRLRFMERWDEIEPMGFDVAFQRKWEYYLAYCEAGFAERHVNVCQLIFGRADETTYQYELASPNLQNQSPATWEPVASQEY
ncbi:MAG TPA: hypothetical protein DIV79_03140 [Opitutae bacterium]|nr:hypothetical protein [Opitutae bacterium]